jgi:hypothetical protein
LAEALLLDTTYLLPVFGIDVGLASRNSKFASVVTHI